MKGQKVYLDTNTFIYALEGFSAFRSPLIQRFDLIEDGHVTAVTSELTLAELLVKPLRDGNEVLQRRYQQLLAGSDVLQVVPIARSILVSAARVRAGNGYKLPDAIHIATASYCQCTCFLTNDLEIVGVQGLTTLRLQSLLVAE